jgi:RNA polymerase sigma factor (sigma-70 family)
MEINDNLSSKAKHDLALIRRAVNDSDQKAYAELLQRYRDSLFYTMLKMVDNHEDADDLTIEAFAKAFKKLPTYTPDYAFSTWLFKIASNNAIDFIRKKRLKAVSIDRGFQSADGSRVEINVADSIGDPSDHLEKDERIQKMREIVEKLKPRYKRLVELRYFEEKSYEEISEMQNLPLGTVKAQLFRARDLLLQMMQDKKENY